MPIIIEILVFFGFIGAIVWTGIKHTAKTVVVGVKKKMEAREQKMTGHNNNTTIHPMNEFTYKEKEAIIAILYTIAVGSSGNIEPEKEACIHFIATSMSYQITEYGLATTNIAKCMDTLIGMSDENKNEFIMFVYGVMRCSGNGASQEELLISEQVFTYMRLTAERIAKVIGRSYE